MHSFIASSIYFFSLFYTQFFFTETAIHFHNANGLWSKTYLKKKKSLKGVYQSVALIPTASSLPLCRSLALRSSTMLAKMRVCKFKLVKTKCLANAVRVPQC